MSTPSRFPQCRAEAVNRSNNSRSVAASDRSSRSVPGSVCRDDANRPPAGTPAGTRAGCATDMPGPCAGPMAVAPEALVLMRVQDNASRLIAAFVGGDAADHLMINGADSP